jgi:hypothetical protein
MATYYWVGGSGTWDATLKTNWASASGGAGGAGVPTSADNCLFDANSGTGVLLIGAVGSGGEANCAFFNAGSCPAGLKWYGAVYSGNRSAINIYGTTYFSMPSQITADGNRFNINIRGAMPVICNTSTAVSTVVETITIYAAGATANTITNANSIIVQSGASFALGGFSVQVNVEFNATSGSTVDLTSSTVTVGGAGNNTGTFTISSGATSTLTGSTINMNPATGSQNGTVIFNGGGKAYNIVNIRPNAYATVNDTNSFDTLTVSVSFNYEAFQVLFGANQTVGNSITLTGPDPAYRIMYGSTVAGTQRTITVVGTGTKTISNSDFQDMNISNSGGAITWSGGIGNCLGNNTTNIPFTAPVTRYANPGTWSSTSTWSATAGGATGETTPLPQDTVYIESVSMGVGNLTLGSSIRLCKELNISTPSILFAQILGSSVGYTVYGSATGSQMVNIIIGLSNALFGNAGSIIFAARNVTVNLSGALSWPSTSSSWKGVVIGGINSTYVIADNSVLFSPTFATGSFNAGNRSFTMPAGLVASQSSVFNVTTVRLRHLGALPAPYFAMGAGTITLGSGANNAYTNGIFIETLDAASNFTSCNIVLTGGTTASTTLSVSNTTTTFGEITLSPGSSTGWTTGLTVSVPATVTFNRLSRGNFNPIKQITIPTTYQFNVTNFDFYGIQGYGTLISGTATGLATTAPSVLNIGSSINTSYIGFRNITVTGGAIKAYGVADFGANTGITFPSTLKTLAWDAAGAGSFTIPSDFGGSSVVLICGGGGGGYGGSVTTIGGGGGGSAGASFAFNPTLTTGSTVYYQVGAGGLGASGASAATAGSQSYFNALAAAYPSDVKTGCGANGGGAGGVANGGTAGAAGVGWATSAGAVGGAAAPTSAAYRGGGGGAGSGRFQLNVNSTYFNSYNYFPYGGAIGGGGATSSGGGGGGGYFSTFTGKPQNNDGSIATAGAGGAGANGTGNLPSGGTTGTITVRTGGAGVTNPSGAYIAQGGGGGGGGYDDATGGGGGQAGDGIYSLDFTYTQLNGSVASGSIGFGSGGGGGGGTSVSNATYSAGNGGSGSYGSGGGAGGGAISTKSGSGGNGGRGLVVFIYAVALANSGSSQSGIIG